MSKVKGESALFNPRPRPSTSVTLDIPTDSYETLSQVAESRDMSPDALLKFYIGQGLRQDEAKLFSDRVLQKTAQVLIKHIASEEERAAILKEIQQQTAG